MARRVLRRGERALVAVSGGPDSVAMLDVLVRLAPELELQLEVAAVDHGLRPEAAREVELVGRHAYERSVPFHALALGLAPGPNVQERAREARYAALHQLARSRDATAIAVGHTRDDQAETVLLRLLRGSGIRGLGGVEPRRADGIARPLIDASRQDVLEWVEHHGLTCILDPSNLDPRHARVRVRSQLLPLLRHEDRHADAHLSDLADEARELTEFVESLAAYAYRSANLGRELRCEPLTPLVRVVRTRVWCMWISDLTGDFPKRAHLDALEAVLQGKGQALLPKGFVVTKSEGKLVAERRYEA
jgi:tRNA(Ile)-lysidine synthase